MLSIDCACVQKNLSQVQNSALMAEGSTKCPKSPTKELSDSDTSEQEQVNPRLTTSEEERHHETMWFSISYRDSTQPLQGSSQSNS